MNVKQVEVAVGVLVERSGEQGGWRVLIAKRPDATVLGGYWELPGGKREPGESMATCLAREFREELGVTVLVGEALPVISHAYPHAHVVLHPFFCQRVSGEPENLQVAEHRWVSPEELLQYRFPEANTELIAYVHRRLSGPAKGP
jgi:mutator protein MutT